MINPANAISIARTIMVFASIYLLLEIQGDVANVTALIIITIAVLLDAVDGKIARLFGFQSETGILTDLYADHIVANLIWVSLAFLGLVPIWIPLIATTRDLVVDWFRQVGSIKTGLNGFEQVTSLSFGWISASRTMRGLYGELKLVVWGLALLSIYFPLPTLVSLLAWTTLGICLLRAFPAISASWRFVVFVEPK